MQNHYRNSPAIISEKTSTIVNMLRRDVTWGELRSIHKHAQETGQFHAEDLLANETVMEQSVGEEDSDYVSGIFLEEIEMYKRIDEGSAVSFFFTRDNDGQFKALVKAADDTFYLREAESWRPVRPDKEEPSLDDLYQVQTRQDAVVRWDSLEGTELISEKDLNRFI